MSISTVGDDTGFDPSSPLFCQPPCNRSKEPAMRMTLKPVNKKLPDLQRSAREDGDDEDV